MASVLPFNASQILCPVDRSELSSLALKYAVVGAKVFSARLTVLEAVHFEYPRYLSEELTNTVLEELGQYKASARKDLATYVRSIIGDAVDHIRISYRVSDQQPAQAISQAIEEAVSDLLIMGTHGYSGMKHWMLGSVTESLLHSSRIPIFAVRQKTDAFIDVNHPDAKPEILHVLCPCDMSPASARALQVAASLAQRFDARLAVLWISESEDAGESELFQNWFTRTLPEHPSASIVIKRGKAADLVIDTAVEMQSDLIVIGARHRSFGEATVLGRTTELVMRHAPVPVLAVPFFDEAD
jgi:nucleotide-binding universal stress UspA family protein